MIRALGDDSRVDAGLVHGDHARALSVGNAFAIHQRAVRVPERNITMLGTILIILLILMLVGGLPVFPYSRKWGYAPGGVLGTILVIVIILMLLGYLR